MNNQNIEMLRNILDALMSISVKGSDTITLANCMQALQNVIDSEQRAAMAPTMTPVADDEAAPQE